MTLEGRAVDESQVDAMASSCARGWLRVLAAIVIIGVIVVAAWHLGDSDEALAKLRAASPLDIAGILTLLALVMTSNGLVLRTLVAHIGVALPVRTWLGVTFVASMLNLITPVSGAGAMRAVYLKQVHDVAFTAFAGLLAVAFAFSIGVTASLAAFALLALGVPGGQSGVLALLLSGGLVLALVVGLIIGRLIAPKPPPAEAAGRVAALRRRLVDAALSWQALAHNYGLVWRLVWWNFVGAGLYAAAFVLAFRVSGFEGMWLVPWASAAFARIGSLLSVTPAGLGIVEAFGVVSAQIVGAAFGEALVAVLVIRVCSTVVSIVGGAIASPFVASFRDPS